MGAVRRHDDPPRTSTARQIGTPVPAAVSVYYGMPTGDDFYLGDYGGPCASPLGFVGDIDAAAVLGRYDSDRHAGA